MNLPRRTALLLPAVVLLGFAVFCEAVQFGIFFDEDGQSLVIEALQESLQSLHYQSPSSYDADASNFTTTTTTKRVKRQFGSPFQFQFPAGWPFVQHQQGGAGGFPGFPAGFPAAFPTRPPATAPTTTTMRTTTAAPSQMGSCRTRNGLSGRCATFRSCYPFVFSSEDGHEEKFRNPGLAADIKERAGPCDLHAMPNYLIFRADVPMRDNMICCAGQESASSYPPKPRPQIPGIGGHFHPQITMRPPWAAWTTKPTTTTTTTTMMPTTTTTRYTTRYTTTTRPTRATLFPNYPNWPPPFITHPPSHFTWATHAPQQIHHTNPTTTQRVPQHTWTTHRPQGTMSTPSPVTQAPVSSSCGFGKIVGGSQATKGEFPWLVAIMRHGRQICGGSLLDSQWVLSAAHCFANFQPYDVAGLKIQIGDYDIYSNSDGPVTIRSVTKLVRHTGFSMHTLHNDVALLKLDSPVQFGSNGNNNIQPICLARSGPSEGSTVTVAGWGGIYEGGPQPAIYKKVNLQIWANQQCAGKYGHRAPGGITSNMVCAGSPNADACRGDSGGPLMRNTGGRWEQIGIVSWGIGCGSYPGVYTRIERYGDWIASNRRH